MEKKHHTHVGSNIRRFRDFLGWKQQLMAVKLGRGWDQKKISRLEYSKNVPKDLLIKIAVIFGLPVEVLEEGSEEDFLSIIRNNFKH